MPRKLDLSRIGAVYERLTIVDVTRRNGRPAWLCRCACGNSHSIVSDAWGKIKTCGHCTDIKRRANRTLIFQSWRAMLNRCTNTKYHQYHLYGGRGITVCERWLLFENFVADMGPRPEGKSLDRKNNAAGYAPGNCQWRSDLEQGSNKRNNRFFTSEKYGSLTAPQAARIAGVSHGTITHRVTKLGLTLDEAIAYPPGKHTGDLSVAQFEQILAMSDCTQRVVAEVVGTSQTTVSNVRLGKHPLCQKMLYNTALSSTTEP
jgi:hypothetical protein